MSLVFQWEKRMSQWSPWRCRTNSIFCSLFSPAQCPPGWSQDIRTFSAVFSNVDLPAEFSLLLKSFRDENEKVSSRFFVFFAAFLAISSSTKIGQGWIEDFTPTQNCLRCELRARLSIFSQALRVQTKKRNYPLPNTYNI